MQLTYSEGLMQKSSWMDKICGTSQIRAKQNLLPSFFIIGPPRTGSSWLHEVFQGRTLLPHALKETRFFDLNFHRGLHWYQANYSRKGKPRPMGEVAPTYFASPEARQRISEIVPRARVVCIFRDPVERLFSLYRLKRAYGMIPWNFEEALAHDPEFLETSRYAGHLKAWQQTLGSEQVLAVLYDDLRDHPQSFVDSIADFIGVRRFQLSSAHMRRVFASESMTHPRSYARTHRATAVADWFKGQRLGSVVAAVKRSPLMKLLLGGGTPFGQLPQQVALALYERLRPEVEELESILNRDLSKWKYPYLVATPAQVG